MDRRTTTARIGAGWLAAGLVVVLAGGAAWADGPDTKRVLDAQKAANDAYVDYILAQKSMWWDVYRFWKESETFWPWEVGKMIWWGKIASRNPNPNRIVPSGNEELWEVWQKWRGAYLDAIYANDRELSRVMEKTQQAIDNTTEFQRDAEMALTVAEHAKVAEKGLAEAGKYAGKKVAQWIISECIQGTIGKAVGEAQDSFLLSVGMDSSQIEYLRLAARVVGGIRHAKRMLAAGGGGKSQASSSNAKAMVGKQPPGDGAAPKAATPPTNQLPSSGNKFVVDPKGNTIVVKPGETFTSSPDGKWIQVRGADGKPTGTRLDGGHKPSTHSDPRGQQPHAHVPGVTNPDGTPWLPVNQ